MRNNNMARARAQELNKDEGKTTERRKARERGSEEAGRLIESNKFSW